MTELGLWERFQDDGPVPSPGTVSAWGRPEPVETEHQLRSGIARGELIARGRPIVLAGGSEAQHRKAQRQLLRIGFDTIAGEFDGGMDAWRASGRDLSSFETVDVEDMAQWVLSAEPMTVVDARDEHEWASGHVPGAVHMYVPDVPSRAPEIPHDAPVAVHCASGYRAGIAASLLEQAGLKRIIHVNGEYSDWDRLHLAQSRV